MRVSVGMSEVVLRVGPGHTLREAAMKMTEFGIGAAIVEDDEWPVPRILTERDILKAIGTGLDPDVEKVCDHMSESVITESASRWRPVKKSLSMLPVTLTRSPCSICW